MLQFGSGVLWGIPTTGNLATNVTPQRFGTLQDVSIDISQKLVELMGASKFPDDIAPSDMKITGKAGFGKLDINIYNQLFFANAQTTGASPNFVKDEADTIPASVSYVITVTNSASFTKDLGVLYAATGIPFIRIPSGTPTVGQYTVSAGVYTFAAADASAAVLISYLYANSTTGNVLTVVNELQGYGPVFELYLYEPYQGQNGFHLYACRSSKLTQPRKRDGYRIDSFEFSAYANPAGNVMDFFRATE